MDVLKFLNSKRLTVVWLKEQLKQRGYEVCLSYLCRILKGQSQSELALRIIEESKDICRRYETL